MKPYKYLKDLLHSTTLFLTFVLLILLLSLKELFEYIARKIKS